MGTNKIKISTKKRSNHIRQKQTRGESTRNAVSLNKFKKKLEKKKSREFFETKLERTGQRKNIEHGKSVAKYDDIEADDVMDMLDPENLRDIENLKFGFTNINNEQQRTKRKRKRLNSGDSSDCDNHEKLYSSNYNERNVKMLLPIKTKEGEVIVRKMSIGANIKPIEKPPEQKKITSDLKNNEDIHESEDESDYNSDNDIINEEEHPGTAIKSYKAISTTDLLILREHEIQRQKYRIGIICSGILEKPGDKMKNFEPLLEFMDYQTRNGAINLVSIRKIATISVLELFKDIIPEYRVGFVDLKTIKVKKDTLERVTFENSLLKYYKNYLQKLEKFAQIFTKKNKAFKITPDMVVMGELSVDCLCELIIAHPYFNFGQNVAQVLVTLSNCKNSKIRSIVEKTITTIYKTDQRFDLSLFFVRRTNNLIKKHGNNVYVDVLSPLISLPLKNINLDAEKEKELKQQKLKSHKSHMMNMSKREKKKAKKLKELDRELQETSAEENKQTKHFKLTEMTKLMFTIYFRILKNNPQSKLLSAAVEGMAKFAHIINIEFFEDFVNVLNGLIEHDELGYREQLHCIHTVFIILSGQGEIFNIDPGRFYTHLYQNLLCTTAGQHSNDLQMILKILFEVIIKRRKHITQQRMTAFMKRIGMLSLQVQHNGTLALLAIVKTAMQLNNNFNILLDTDNTVGSEKFNPDINEPEYSKANCTSLFELCALSRSYHPTVKKIAKYVAFGAPTNGEVNLNPELCKMSSDDFLVKFDSSEMMFNPAIPTPKMCQPKIHPIHQYYLDTKLQNIFREKIFAPTKFDHNGFNFDFFAKRSAL